MDLQYLKECFDCDYTEGVLYWKSRPSHHFESEIKADNFNRRFSGKQACKPHKVTGGIWYNRVRIGSKSLLSHRVLTQLFYSETLQGFVIDHFDRDGLNNSISNLRVTRHRGNMKNMGLYANNSSNISGVSLCKSGYYLAEIYNSCGGRDRFYTKDFFEACCVRKGWMLREDYTASHGH